MSGWTVPPTRRELTLLLFCATIFIIAFNATTTLRLMGVDPSSLTSFSSSPVRLGLDGRRLEGYRDRLENEIFGEWEWEPGHIAGVKDAESTRLLHGKPHGHPDAYVRGEGRNGKQAMWLLGVGEGQYISGEGLGLTSVNDGFVRWGEDVPRTELRQHTPGFTILDNVIMLDGTFYVIVDDPTSMPAIETIASPRVNEIDPPSHIDWQVFPARTALSEFGSYGGRIHGVTFVSCDGPSTTDSHTLLSLMRLYSTLNMSSPQSLSPPHRIIFPTISTFADLHPETADENIPRRRANIGVAPETLKAAYPSLVGAQFAEDFVDFVNISMPVLLDRVVSLTVVRRSTSNYLTVCPRGRRRSLRSEGPRTGSTLYGGGWRSTFLARMTVLSPALRERIQSHTFLGRAGLMATDCSLRTMPSCWMC